MASDDVLQNWPMTMLISSEFDPYVVANERFAMRLEDNGRLVENVVYPGADHGFFYNLSYKLS